MIEKKQRTQSTEKLLQRLFHVFRRLSAEKDSPALEIMSCTLTLQPGMMINVSKLFISGS